MAIGLGAKLARLLLLSFNLIFWLSGVALIGTGVWLLVDESKAILFAIVQVEATIPMIKIGAYAVIGIGVFVFFVGILGCCGAMHENRCMLVSYFGVVLLILLAQIVGGILVVVYKNTLEQGLQDNMQNNLQHNYYRNLEVTAGFDYAQYSFQCCGVRGPSDYSNFTDGNRPHSGPRFETVPISCCTASGNSYKDIQPTDRTKCQDKENWPGFRYKDGCYIQVKEVIGNLHGILIGVGVGIAVLELLGMLFAICLCRNIDYDI